jgi:hypothetical protein
MINNGASPYVFKINGVVHYRIGALLPQQGTRPRFAQLYIHDTKKNITGLIYSKMMTTTMYNQILMLPFL